MAIQGAQIPMYTKHTIFVFFWFFNFNFFFIFIWKTKQSKTEKQTKKMLNKAKYKN